MVDQILLAVVVVLSGSGASGSSSGSGASINGNSIFGKVDTMMKKMMMKKKY